MRERWVKGNVDVSALKDKIIAFFKEREFSISVKEDDGEFLIIASPHKVHKIAEKIVVKISGNSNDFSVEFVAGKHSSDLVKLGSLLTIIGGGF